MSLSPAILAMVDAAAAKHRARQIETKGWRSLAHRRAELVGMKRFFAPDIDDLSFEGRKAMVRRIASALRFEQRISDRDHSAHRIYSPAIITGLQFAHQAELLAVQAMQAEAQYLEAAE